MDGAELSAIKRGAGAGLPFKWAFNTHTLYIKRISPL